jgi:magnesium chelatase family protein
MVAAMNPCPCGYYGDSLKLCTCSQAFITTYQKRISGPLLDRIDIHIQVPRVNYDRLSDERFGESSAVIRKRVEAAREVQRQRFSSSEFVEKGIFCNADMHNSEIRSYCKLSIECQNLMRAAMQQMNLSARAYHRILKLARTIADLAYSEDINTTHLAEALQYRPQVLF